MNLPPRPDETVAVASALFSGAAWCFAGAFCSERVGAEFLPCFVAAAAVVARGTLDGRKTTSVWGCRVLGLAFVGVAVSFGLAVARVARAFPDRAFWAATAGAGAACAFGELALRATVL